MGYNHAWDNSHAILNKVHAWSMTYIDVSHRDLRCRFWLFLCRQPGSKSHIQPVRPQQCAADASATLCGTCTSCLPRRPVAADAARVSGSHLLVAWLPLLPHAALQSSPLCSAFWDRPAAREREHMCDTGDAHFTDPPGSHTSCHDAVSPSP